MISKEELRNLLKPYYRQVEQISDTVFIAHRYAGEQLYQILFFDLSDLFLSYDLQSYTKQHIATRYFKSQGDLQWNFYLVFLTDLPINEDARRRIESNVEYARKFIVSTDDFPNWLNRLYVRKSTGNLTAGLSDQWKQYLSDHQLDCISSTEIKLNDGVEGIISGKPLTERTSSRSSGRVDNADIELGSLTMLNPKRYRPYPKFSQPLTFTKVNLIDGANGHGKTSLLEAIEYLVTGSNQRVNSNEENYLIEGKFSNDNKIRKNSKNNELLRARDRAWYNGMGRLRGSDLTSHFNRFNFYNTDAAFRLTLNKDEGDIEIAFREIALGDEINFLKKQIDAYQSKLQGEIRTRDKRIHEYNTDLDQQTKLLTSLRQTEGRGTALIDAFFTEIGKSGIKLPAGDRDLVSLDRQKFELTKLTAEIQQAVVSIDWLEGISLESLDAEERRLSNLFNEIREYDRAVEADSATSATYHLAIERASNTIKFLDELENYIAIDQVTPIAGLRSRINSNQNDLSLLKRMYDSYQTVSGFVFSQPNSLSGDFRQQLQTQLQAADETIRRIDDQLAQSRRVTSELNALIASLRDETRQYIELAPGASDCPVCHTPFENPQALRRTILQQLEQVVPENDLSSLLQLKSEAESTRNKMQEEMNKLTALTDTFIILQSALPAQVTISQLIVTIDAAIDTIPLVETEQLQLEQLAQLLQNRLLSEERFNVLREMFRSRYSNSRMSLELTEKASEFEQRLVKENQDKLDAAKRLLDKQAAELDLTIKSYDPYLDIVDRNNLAQRAAIITHYMEMIGKYLTDQFDHKKNLNTFMLELNTLVQQLDEIRADIELSQKESGIAKQADAAIKEKTRLKNDALKERNNIDEALNKLSRLDQLHNEDVFLSDFLLRNKQEIRDIFLAIHAPKEFTDIELKDGKILLTKNTDDITDLTRISTGQRSALALSLFLTLNNKLKNGPSMILFDDPVAFTDDLNILSFLDYLREISLDNSREKQLFFATANENLAFLFQKKFGMFGEQFSHLTLER